VWDGGSATAVAASAAVAALQRSKWWRTRGDSGGRMAAVAARPRPAVAAAAVSGGRSCLCEGPWHGSTHRAVYEGTKSHHLPPTPLTEGVILSSGTQNESVASF
jgi:hypothetical protein